MRNRVRGILFTLFVAGAVAPLHAQDIRRISDEPSRKGFWLGLGVAGGKYDNDCDGCAASDPVSAIGSHLRLGGTLSQRFRLGLDLFGLVANKGQFGDLSGSGADSKENVGDATVSLWFYPSAAGNLWLQAGVGGVAYMSDVKGDQKYTAVSGGGVLGAGYDFRVGRNGSLTPYIHWAAGNNGKLKDEGGNEVSGPGTWKTSYFAFGVDYVFH